MIGYKKKYGENIILVLHLFQKKKKVKNTMIYYKKWKLKQEENLNPRSKSAELSKKKKKQRLKSKLHYLNLIEIYFSLLTLLLLNWVL